MEVDSIKQPKVYGLGLTDIEIIIKKELKLTCEGLSPLSGELKVDGVLSDEVKELLGNEDFMNAAAVLASPSFKIPFNKGGGGEIGERFTVYGLKKGEKTLLVSLYSGQDALILYSFENAESFAIWFANGYASKAQEQVANVIAPKISVEELVCILHLVDCYKRVQMCSMLDYVSIESPFIPAFDYAATLKASVEKRDLRWLLPTFFELMPGLSEKKFDINREHLNAAIIIGLISETKQPENDVIYQYNIYGKVLGVEFERTWGFGMGFNVITNRGQGNAIFFAPTSIANHIFTLENDEISHIVLTQIGITNAIYDMINDIKI